MTILRCGNRCWNGVLAGLLVLSAGCRAVPPLPPVNLSAPGWTVRQGQAVWKRERDVPEIAGELLVATGPEDRAFVQFSKDPFPLVTAQSTRDRWQVETPIDNRRYAGRGLPPVRLQFLYLPRVLAGLPPPRGWTWRKIDENGWRLENPARGEWLEAHFAQ